MDTHLLTNKPINSQHLAGIKQLNGSKFDASAFARHRDLRFE